MQYGITGLALGCRQFVELTRDGYNAAKQAKACLLVALGIEEKFNLVLENHAEFELELQRLTTRKLIFQDHDWSCIMDDVYAINRRLVNLMSAGRLYIDHVKRDTGGLFGSNSGQSEELKAAFAEQYDAHLGYRVFEALRNHVLHRNLPVHELTYDSSLDDHKQAVSVKHTCIPSMSITMVEEQGGFKAEVLKELKKGDESVDLRPLARQYVASIGQVHTVLRKGMSEAVASWDAQMKLIRAKFRKTYGNELIGLALVKSDGQGAVMESTPIVENVVTRRKSLEEKNRTATNLRNHYVSTQADAVD